MRKARFSRKWLGSILQIALLLSAFSGVGLAEQRNSVAEATNHVNAVDGHRMLAKEVRLSNVDAFEAQLRRDLPLGTSKADVEAYLAQLNIRHAYVGPHNAYQAVIDDIGMRQGFQASLDIWVSLDADEKVKEIRLHVQYL